MARSSDLGNDGHERLDALAAEFVERLRSGERPEIEEYTARHPELSDSIRYLFPTLLVMEQPATPHGTSHSETRVRERLGEFHVLREIGRGGMGVVYEAEQQSLARRVAIKVLGAGLLSSDVQVERFRREAKSAARLHHTNIVPVFGFGESHGFHYYAMQYIRGHSLRELLSAIEASDGSESHSERDTPVVSGSAHETHLVRAATGDGGASMTYYRAVAGIGRQVAHALHYAHGQGVLHRDIKPANILLDEAATAWISDFGLAKAVDSEELTATGHVPGTLGYVAPERFEGAEDQRSDVYSLGVTLYELIARRPAFSRVDGAVLVRDVVTKELTPLRRLDRRLPDDLATIVQKAISRSPRDRYSSAKELADDLDRFLRREPIAARRTPWLTRLARRCQRNPIVTALTAAIFVLGIVLVIGSLSSAHRLRKERDATRENLWAAKLAEGRARRLEGSAEQRVLALAALEIAAEGAPTVETRTEVLGALALTGLREELSHTLADGIPIVSADGRRMVAHDPTDTATFVRDTESPEAVIATLRTDEQWPGAALSSTGRYFASGTDPQGYLKVWDVDQEALIGELTNVSARSNVEFAPQDDVLAVSVATGGILLYSLPQLEKLRRLPFEPAIRRLRFDPSGTRLAVVARGSYGFSVRVIDVADGTERQRLDHGDDVYEVSWHPRGRLLAAASRDFNVHLWDVVNRERVHELEGHGGEVVRVNFSPTGDYLLSSAWDGRTILWDSYSGRSLASVRGASAQFFPDGRRFATSRFGRFRVHRIVGGEYRILHVPVAARQQKYPRTVVVSNDGRWVGCDTSWGYRVWSAPDSALFLDLKVGPPGGGIEFAPAGDAVYVSVVDRGILRVPIRDDAAVKDSVVFGPAERIGIPSDRFALGADGTILAVAAGSEERVRVYRLTPEPVEVGSYPHVRVSRTQISTSGRWVGSTNWQGEDMVFWDVEAEEEVTRLKFRSAPFRFSPDERWVLVCDGHGFRLISTTTWESEHYWAGSGSRSAAFFPNGRFAAVALAPDQVNIVRVPSGELIAALEAPEFETLAWLSLGVDGGTVYAASPEKRAVRVWNLTAMRHELRRMGLDWEMESVGRPASPNAPAALRFVPSAEDLEATRANHFLAASRVEKQRGALNLLVETGSSPEHLAARAAHHEQYAAPEAAIADLESALDAESESFEWREQRARLLEGLGRANSALEDLDVLVVRARSELGGDAEAYWRTKLAELLRRRQQVLDTLGMRERAEQDRAAIESLRESAR